MLKISSFKINMHFIILYYIKNIKKYITYLDNNIKIIKVYNFLKIFIQLTILLVNAI
jgi:hypothetical protein